MENNNQPKMPKPVAPKQPKSNPNKALNQMGLKEKDLEPVDQSPMFKAKQAAIEAGKKGGYTDFSDFDEKGELMSRPARTVSMMGDNSKFHPDAQIRGIKDFGDHFEYQLKNPDEKDFKDMRYDEKGGHIDKALYEAKKNIVPKKGFPNRSGLKEVEYGSADKENAKKILNGSDPLMDLYKSLMDTTNSLYKKKEQPKPEQPKENDISIDSNINVTLPDGGSDIVNVDDLGEKLIEYLSSDVDLTDEDKQYIMDNMRVPEHANPFDTPKRLQEDFKEWLIDNYYSGKKYFK